MDIIISLEATCDLSKEIIKKNNFRIVNMNFMIDDEEYNTENDDGETSQLYEKMKNGKKTTTTLVNEDTYIQHFNELLKENKPIIHLALSSGLSGTYNMAKNAEKQVNLMAKDNNNVFVLDTLCGCSGQGLLAILVSKFAKKAKTIDDIINYVNDVKMKIRHTYTVDVLKYLVNGGRVNRSAAFIGTLLNIKPVMRLSEDGKLVLTQKVISRKKALNLLFDELKQTYDPNGEICFISQSSCPADAEYIKQLISTQTSLTPIVNTLGPIIGSHSGPGTFALFYLSQNRVPFKC